MRTLLLATIALVLLGLSPWSEDAPDTRVPEPAISYRVRVRDIDLNTFDIVKATFDGHVFLTGSIGKAKVSVPFEKIDMVWFEAAEGSDVVAMVTLKSGETQKLIVNGNTPCYGVAAYGNIAIDIKHLRDAKFQGRE
jgi:hypothetical protein